MFFYDILMFFLCDISVFYVKHIYIYIDIYLNIYTTKI